jgi:hypothetical protein
MRLDHLELTLLLVTLAGPSGTAVRLGRAAVQGGEKPARQQDSERAIALLVRDLQMDLEGSSSSSILGRIDSAKFDDFPRFQDMVERLTREDTLRVFFRQTSSTVKEDQAQTVLDGEMEMIRKDSAVPAQHRKQQITIDLELTSRGWKIINISPRDFFQPL